MQMSPDCNCYQNVSVNKTQMSPKGKCHQIGNVTKTQMSKLKYKLNAIVTKNPSVTKHTNFTKTQISPLGLTFIYIYLLNGSGTRCPGLFPKNPGHGVTPDLFFKFF